MNWGESLTTLGISSILIAGLVYLGKRISEHLFSRDLEKFKAELQMHNNVEIERLRSDLRVAAFSKEVRLLKLHEKRAEVIAELYSKLSDTHRVLLSLVNPVQFSGEASFEQKAAEADRSAAEFKRYFNEKRIYFEKSLCDEIGRFIQTLEESSRKFSYARPGGPGEKYEKSVDIWQQAWDNLTKDANNIRQKIEDEFRMLLGSITIDTIKNSDSSN